MMIMIDNDDDPGKMEDLSPITKLSSTGGGVGLSLNPQMGR